MKFKKGDLVRWKKDNDLAVVVKPFLADEPDCIQVKWLVGEYEGEYTEPVACNFALFVRPTFNKSKRTK